MTDDRQTKDESGSLAAEYALGVLTGDELEQARRQYGDDAQFRADVARWRGRLAPLADDVEPIEPPATLWRTIDSRIGADPAADNVVQLRRRVTQWQAAAGVMTALAACLAVVLVIRPVPSQPPAATVPATQTATERQPPPMVAMLGADAKDMAVVASWDPAAHRLVLVVPKAMPSAPGRSHELWVIPGDGKPRSLGVMPAGQQMHMELADALARLLQQGATIAISVEPSGGSPTGQPTGPVVASGALKSA